MKKIFMTLGVFAAMLFASYGLISCSSSGDPLEETQNTYNVIYAEAAFCSAVASINEEFLINRAIAARYDSMKSSFFKPYHSSDYSKGYVLYGWDIVRNNGSVETKQYRKDIIVTFDEKTGIYHWRTY